MAPLNCNTSIIDRKAEESKTEPETTKLTKEELLKELHSNYYFYLFQGPYIPKESKPKESQPKEESEHEESENEESENYESETDESEDEEIGECKYCLKVGDHHTELCSYIDEVPENAIVGESCVVTCLVCGCFFRDSRCANCGITLGRALFKDCLICGKRGEHMEFECPELEPNPDFSFDPYVPSIIVYNRP
ncbi:uncharacterized protein LOC117626342 isoform X1 [Prunus dulcis]|uniref:uncharacterized protein LOC117626342 isoform X1 n=1 Tax=Prunus dulcis TaxID=3755 RepID=UPI0014820F14|nr:uncharacterized protein LOC117626342 isoform X1 [Prunus dulcis]